MFRDSRHMLLILLIALSIVCPLFISLTGMIDTVIGLVLYGIVLPSSPFVFLAILSLRKEGNSYKYKGSAILGSMQGALIAIFVPYALIWYSVATYTGGGANIGLALLALAMPLYLPVAMRVGWSLGARNNAI